MTETNFHHHPDYDKLPEAVKAYVTAKAYAWMTDPERQRLLDDMCYPEPD